MAIIAVRIDDVWQKAESIGKPDKDGTTLYNLNGLVRKAMRSQWIKLGAWVSPGNYESHIISRNIDTLYNIIRNKEILKKTAERAQQAQQVNPAPAQEDEGEIDDDFEVLIGLDEDEPRRPDEGEIDPNCQCQACKAVRNERRQRFSLRSIFDE